MIQAIGIMIGAYIFTKMLNLVVTPSTITGVKVFAVITMLVTIFCVLDLLVMGTVAPTGLQ